MLYCKIIDYKNANQNFYLSISHFTRVCTTVDVVGIKFSLKNTIPYGPYGYSETIFDAVVQSLTEINRSSLRVLDF